MAENKVSVEITLEEKAALKALTQLSREIQKTETGFKDMGKTGDESLGLVSSAAKGVSDGFGSLVKGVTIANLASSAIIGTANAIKNFAIDSVNAAAESEEATNRLGQSLKAVGAFSEQTMADFLDYASALAQVTVYSDDAITGQLGLAKSFGASNQQAKDLVKAAAELAATFGGSLESRVQQLGKTLQGTGGKLDTLIPGFKALTEAQLKSGEAIDFINGKLGGAAANEITTYSGKLAQATKAFSELQEVIGGFVLDSGITEAFSATAFAINAFTESIADARIATQRQAEGFTETTASAAQLKREYEALQVKAIDLEQTILNPQNGALADKTAMFIAKKQLKELNDEIASTKALIASISPAVQKGVDNAPQGVVATDDAEDPRIAKEKTAQIEIAMIREQASIAASEQDALLSEQLISNRELEIEAIYAFEARKLEAQFSAEEEKAKLIKSSSEKSLKLQEISTKRELEFTKLGNAQIKAENQRKIKDQESINAALIITATNFLAAGQLLAKEGSNAQKAFQITQATMSTYAAANNALAQPVPYPVAVAMAASAVALGLANVAKISGAKFQYGGIVPGSSMTGDSVPARVNSGEMILNRQQQTELFNMANGGGSDSSMNEAIERLTRAIMNQPINLVVDGRTLATVIRKEVQSGFRLS